MRTNWKLLPIILMAGLGCASAHEEQLPREGGGAPGEQSPLLAGAAAGADKSRAAVRCEHGKLNTQDADPLGEGAWQLQFNLGYGRSTLQWDSSWQEERRDRSYEWSNQEVLTYGVSDTLDLGLGLGYAGLADDDTGLESGHGLSDLAASGKWRFFEKEAWGMAVAYLPTLTIPVGKDSTTDRLGPSQEFWSLDTRFAVVKDWSERWSANFDIGYVAAFGKGAGCPGSFSANGAVGYQLLRRLQPEVEMNYSHDFVREGGDADLVAMTVGFDMPFSDRVCARGGVQHGLAGRNADRTSAILLSMDLNF